MTTEVADPGTEAWIRFILLPSSEEEQEFFAFDELKCQSLTHDHGRVKCSEDVAYRVVSCSPDMLVCTAMGLHALEVLEMRSCYCDECGRDAEDCWKIFPV